jgi:hypothetical protein
VSNLGQDAPPKVAAKVPDFVLRVRQGDNYGFPHCNWLVRRACKGFTRPFRFFAPHTDVMGLGIIGKRLYMSEFAPRKVQWMSLNGGRARNLATGFTSEIVGLGVHGGSVYVAQTASGPTSLGFIFRIKP